MMTSYTPKDGDLVQLNFNAYRRDRRALGVIFVTPKDCVGVELENGCVYSVNEHVNPSPADPVALAVHVADHEGEYAIDARVLAREVLRLKRLVCASKEGGA
jgi:hypothetical protein